MELFKAHNQWKTRPNDERFETVQAMHNACESYRNQAIESDVRYKDLRVEADNGDINIVGKENVPAKLSHWAFGQLSQRANAPAGYLRELPATLAAQNLNHGLKARGDESPSDTASLMFHKNGSLILRAATSDKYSRIWNSEITKRLLELQASNPNWVNPMAYKVLSAGKDGNWPEFSQEMAPSGLYASDHDMFAFLVDESRVIDDGANGIKRGFFIWNSEVGDKSFGCMKFGYQTVCGNNIVWGATDVSEIRVRHVGDASNRGFRQIAVELRKYMDSSISEDQAQVSKARSFELGKSPLEVLDTVMSFVGKSRIADLPKARVETALKIADQRQDRYGNPNTVWAVVSGLTEASQAIPYADQRLKVDRAAGKLLKMAF